jgi:hypothetical protein
MTFLAHQLSAFVLIGCVLGAPPAHAQTIVTLGSGFNYPVGVTVDGAGNVFVADYGNIECTEEERKEFEMN